MLKEDTVRTLFFEAILSTVLVAILSEFHHENKWLRSNGTGLSSLFGELRRMGETHYLWYLTLVYD